VPRLAPAFDMAPALFAPGPDGQVIQREFPVPRATAETLDVWSKALDAARQFWNLARGDARLSDDMRAICAANAGR